MPEKKSYDPLDDGKIQVPKVNIKQCSVDLTPGNTGVKWGLLHQKQKIENLILEWESLTSILGEMENLIHRLEYTRDVNFSVSLYEITTGSEEKTE
jgi:hypothetical protein